MVRPYSLDLRERVDVGLESLASSSGPPVLQKAIHVQVGEDGADHPALRCPAGAVLAAAKSLWARLRLRIHFTRCVVSVLSS
jgi:hypothetical protein